MDYLQKEGDMNSTPTYAIFINRDKPLRDNIGKPSKITPEDLLDKLKKALVQIPGSIPLNPAFQENPNTRRIYFLLMEYHHAYLTLDWSNYPPNKINPLGSTRIETRGHYVGEPNFAMKELEQIAAEHGLKQF
tara:strand:+ start:35 stop:433 length:399 start_codon:yes stop_codon:yes gene_type:complete